MAKMVSLQDMVKLVSSLLKTDDLNEWEKGFVASLCNRMGANNETNFSEKQIDKLTDIYKKHFE